jgi:hypothetical protein
LAALLGHKAGFRVASIPDDLLETEAVELAVWSAECRIVGDQLGDIGIGKRKTDLACAFIEQNLREDLADQQPVETGRPRLIRAERSP